MPKRKRFDWANQTDPETGEPTRFCTRCKAFLTLDQFHPCHLKRRTMLCQKHVNESARLEQRRFRKRTLGEPKSVLRLLANTNQFIHRHNLTCAKWTISNVEAALRFHGVDLKTETRHVQLKPCDSSKPFTVENSKVAYRKSGSGFKVMREQTTS